MKIELGKKYVLSDGRVTGVMRKNPGGSQFVYPFIASVPAQIGTGRETDDLTWTDAGHYWSDVQSSDKNLVAEYIEPAQLPEPAQQTKPKIPAELESYILDKLDLQGVGSSPYYLGGRDSLLWLLSDVYGLEAVPAPKFKLQTITK